MMTLASLLYGDDQQAATRLSAQAPTLLTDRRTAGLGVVVPPTDVAAAIADLLTMPVGNLALVAWQRQHAVRAACETTRAQPGSRRVLRLLEHTVRSEQHPSIDVEAGPLHAPLLSLTLRVEMSITAVQLVIEEGGIVGVYPGPASASATLSAGDVVLARRQVTAIDLSVDHSRRAA